MRRNTIRWMMEKENGTRYNVTSCHVFKSTSWSLCSRCLERIKTLHDFFSIFDLPHEACEHIHTHIYSRILSNGTRAILATPCEQSILNYYSCKGMFVATWYSLRGIDECMAFKKNDFEEWNFGNRYWNLVKRKD